MSGGKLKRVGKVTHYFTHISVAVIKLTGTVSVGDKIVIQGVTTDFEQKVASMQIRHVNITVAKTGQSVGLKVENRVREGDTVYKAV